MRARHQQAIVADAGDAAAACCAGVEGGTFADASAFADDQLGAFAFEFKVLRDFANAGEGENHGFIADFSPAGDNGVGFKFDAGAEGDFGTNHAKGADFTAGADCGAGLYYRGGMDLCGHALGRSIMAVNSA
jgi:hypothetical protein